MLTSGLHIGHDQQKCEEVMIAKTYSLQPTFGIIAPVTESVQAHLRHWSILTCDIWVSHSPRKNCTDRAASSSAIAVVSTHELVWYLEMQFLIHHPEAHQGTQSHFCPQLDLKITQEQKGKGCTYQI